MLSRFDLGSLTVYYFIFVQEVLSPPSDGENLSDSTNTSDALSGGGLEDVPSSVRRSVSFKERRKTETPTRRRNSDIDLQVSHSDLKYILVTLEAQTLIFLIKKGIN